MCNDKLMSSLSLSVSELSHTKKRAVKLISWLKLQTMMIHYYFAFLWRELTFQLNANLGSHLEGEKQRLFCCSCPLILDHLFLRIYLGRDLAESLMALMGWSCGCFLTSEQRDGRTLLKFLPLNIHGQRH